LLGLLWGWLPCGLVYTVVAWSLTMGSALDGALLMLGFGIGTLPALLIAGNALNYFRNWVRSPLIRISAGVMVIAFGIYSGFTGLTQRHHHQAESSPATLGIPGASTRIPAILRRVS
jgi:sulfite exporter TauE/SafE